MITLKEILERTVSHLVKSEASDWTPFAPEEVTEDLRRALSAIDAGLEIDKDCLKMHFMPTGSLQEIAMSNYWPDEYLELAEQFDQNIK